MSQSVESVHGYTIQGTYPRAGDKSTTSTLREVISSLFFHPSSIPTQHKSNHSQQYTLEPGMSQSADSEHGYLLLGTHPRAGV